METPNEQITEQVKRRIVDLANKSLDNTESGKKHRGDENTKGFIRTFARWGYWFSIVLSMVLGVFFFIAMTKDAIYGDVATKQIQALTENVNTLSQKLDAQNDKIDKLTDEIHSLVEQNNKEDTDLSQKFNQLIQILQSSNSTAR